MIQTEERPRLHLVMPDEPMKQDAPIPPPGPELAGAILEREFGHLIRRARLRAVGE